MADVWNVGVASVDTSGNATLSGSVTAAGVASSAVVNQQAAMTTGPGAGITGGTGTICVSSIQRHGNIVKTQIMIDLTGLSSTATNGDIIGHNAATDLPAYLGALLATESGAIWEGTMTCLEVPTGGDDDIYLYEATEATGVYDGAIGSLAETLLFDGTGAWTLGEKITMTAVPTAGKYLYLAAGGADTAGVYTAGRFLIEFTGYLA